MAFAEGRRRPYDATSCWRPGWFRKSQLLRTPVTAARNGSHQRYVDYTSTAANGKTTDGPPTTIYVRAQNSQVDAVDSVLGDTADPENPSYVDVSQPSAALTARADAQGAFNGLFLGLGAVALLAAPSGWRTS